MPHQLTCASTRG